LRPPWWQRAWLDVLLLLPFAYGAYLLREQGSILPPVGEGTLANDPFHNPLLFLVPALGIFALTLLLLRILPLVMSGIAWAASYVSGVGGLLAVRYLSRTPAFYAAPLMLLTLTLSLSTFTASLAQTLDRHLHDQTYYAIGADVGLVEWGYEVLSQGGSDGSTDAATEDAGVRWQFLPVSEHLRAPGVQMAARVGRYEATSSLGGRTQTGQFIGIDRVDFAQVAYWRQDFAAASLGALMNGLALYPNAVLVPRTLMAQYALGSGDTFRVAVDMYGQATDLDLEIVGSFDMFPTWYSVTDGPLFVGNLDYLFQQAGAQFPYDVWLSADPDIDYEETLEWFRDSRLRVVEWNAPPRRIAKEMRRPERQGLLGLLSIGFVAAAVLTVLGFLVYTLFSFRRRFIELGILRAIGLSTRQMAAFLAWELAFLILIGTGVGTGLGAWISWLFIPYLQVGTGPTVGIPPFVVELAWPAVFRIYALFSILFVVALGSLALLLRRMRIFQAVKLGDTA
jgi:putative ABC transport system permease protein